jgi:hypothetical protein
MNRIGSSVGAWDYENSGGFFAAAWVPKKSNDQNLIILFHQSTPVKVGMDCFPGHQADECILATEANEAGARNHEKPGLSDSRIRSRAMIGSE